MSKFAVALVAAIALATSVATAAVPNPTVTGPITGGLQGHPLWDSWFEVGSLGYTEAEYFVAGTARQPGSATTATYRTRIIITRPTDPAKFNGTVVMDWVNVTAQFENAVDTVESHDYLLRQGYAFVHVSAQAAGICCTPLTPQVWDPVRYGAPSTTTVLHHPGDAYALDMFAQIAQALKNPTGIDPMGGLEVQRIIATGQSQSAGKLDDYLMQWQGGSGEHVIDALLIHGRVSNRAEAIATAANAKTTQVLQLNSDNEAYPNNPDVNPYYAQWDVAGAAHSSFWIGVHSELGGGPRFAGAAQLPAAADDDLHAGNPPYVGYGTWNYGEQLNPGQPVCILQGDQFPMHYAVNAAFDAIQRWLVDGVAPPVSPRFQFSGSSLARDANSNALGGIRLAPIEHPVASYRSTDCALGGTTVPFTEVQLLSLYPTHADYACQMRETAYQNVKDRFLLEEDAGSLLSRVDAAVNRWPTAPGVTDCDDDAIPDSVDNCPLVANTDQADDGGVNTNTPDGIGNACQCGDVSGNGVVNDEDANAMKRHGLGQEPNPTYRVPGNCDLTGNGLCNGQDANAVRAVALGRSLPPSVFGQNCQNADPYSPTCTNCGQSGTGTTWRIEDGPNEQAQALNAFFSATSGDTIEFGEGAFEFDTTLVAAGDTGLPKDGVTVRGQGPRKTILDFMGSRTPEGLSFSHMDGIKIENLTVLDTPGFSLKVSDSNHVVIQNVRTMWSSADTNPLDSVDDRGGMDPTKPSTLDVSCIEQPGASFPQSTGTYVDANGVTHNYVPSSSNGGYAIYPVLSNNVLIDEAVALGASDAGIYVGQSNDVEIKRSEALFNVAGFEIENTDDADVHDNVAHCNTGGFLTFDLPGLNQYGDETRTFNNRSVFNNTPNFAPGGVVAGVPQGVGMLQLGYDEHEIFNNTIEWNRSVGLVYVGHELLDGNIDNPDKRMDLYPEAVRIHHNTFNHNGTLPQPPETSVIVCEPGTGPGFDSVPPCIPTGINDSDTSLLPALIQIKGALAAQNGDTYGPTGAHIVWDGYFDAAPYACTNPLGSDPASVAEFNSILDANGKPQYTGKHEPLCRYNAYKFSGGVRKAKFTTACIESSNTFSADGRTYMNFKGTDPTVAPDTDVAHAACPPDTLDPIDAAVVEPYTPGPPGTPPPTQAEIEAICASYSGSQINRAALPYNCPLLSQYNLFANPTDPRSGANEGGTRFELTTQLFSDYAKKYRFAFLPPGQQAVWHEGSISAPNATLGFPVGTVIAKTFAFPNGANEEVVETRLLIHRAKSGGGSYWEGMAYIWDEDGSGNRTDAHLAIAGGTASVSWNYADPDPDVGATYVGSTNRYLIPHANQCDSCHINDDKDPGDSPIGLKVRLLNRPMNYGSGAENQLQHWVDGGMLSGAPSLTVDGASKIATNVQRLPRFNVPGDGATANIPASEPERLARIGAAKTEKELRARAFIETNCAHCHNRDGLAQSTGVFFDVYRHVNLNHGICKRPTTAGSSSGGNQYDIVPGHSANSIVSFRIHSTDASTQMPPIARSVVAGEAVGIIDDWIDTVVDEQYEGGACASEYP